MRPDFSLRHIDDIEADSKSLRPLVSLQDLRELIRADLNGSFRPLRAAPNLRRGWLYHAGSLEVALAALDYLYPAELANWKLWLSDQLPIASWKETAERQTGRFRIVRKLDDAALAVLVEQNCQAGCLKKRLWTPFAEEVITGVNEWPLLCPEACNFLVGKAREKMMGAAEE